MRSIIQWAIALLRQPRQNVIVGGFCIVSERLRGLGSALSFRPWL